VNSLNSFEAGLLHDLQNAVQSDFLDRIMPSVTALADFGSFWILLAAVLLCFRKTRRTGATVAAALILGIFVGYLTLKPLIARIRPYDFDPSIVLLVLPEHDFSFPSGHTMASFEGAFSVFLCHRKAGIAALILAALIAFSRLYLMVHYPTDVIAGAVLGCLLACAAYQITGRIAAWSGGKL